MKSRIKVNKILLYGFEKVYGCLKNLRRVCKKRKSQVRGKFEDLLSSSQVLLGQEWQEDSPLLSLLVILHEKW